MTNMNYIQKNDTRAMNGGKTIQCRICKQYVTGNAWTQYCHCVPHATKLVLGVGDAILLCFGLAALI